MLSCSAHVKSRLTYMRGSEGCESRLDAPPHGGSLQIAVLLAIASFACCIGERHISTDLKKLARIVNSINGLHRVLLLSFARTAEAAKRFRFKFTFAREYRSYDRLEEEWAVSGAPPALRQCS